MAQLRVSILDPSGSKKTQAEVPDNVSAHRLIQALATRMNLPALDQSGRPVSYRLTLNRDGEEVVLEEDQTLADVKVQDDDALRLYADMQAGRTES